MSRAAVAWLLLVCGAPLPAVAAEANAVRGKIVAGVRCGPCHYLDKHLKKVGPGLAGIYGRAPSISGVPFQRWDAAALERWLAGPSKVKANTRMSIPAISPRDRRDIIAYFATQREQ